METPPWQTLPADTRQNLTALMVRLILESANVCPVTKSVLRYDETAGELISSAAGLAYPVRDGIAIMLVSEARVLEVSRGGA